MYKARWRSPRVCFARKGIKGGKAYLRQDRFVDTWMKKNGSWVCVSASATPVLH